MVFTPQTPVFSPSYSTDIHQTDNLKDNNNNKPNNF